MAIDDHFSALFSPSELGTACLSFYSVIVTQPFENPKAEDALDFVPAKLDVVSCRFATAPTRYFSTLVSIL